MSNCVQDNYNCVQSQETNDSVQSQDMSSCVQDQNKEAMVDNNIELHMDLIQTVDKPGTDMHVVSEKMTNEIMVKNEAESVYLAENTFDLCIGTKSSMVSEIKSEECGVKLSVDNSVYSDAKAGDCTNTSSKVHSETNNDAPSADIFLELTTKEVGKLLQVTTQNAGSHIPVPDSTAGTSVGWSQNYLKKSQKDNEKLTIIDQSKILFESDISDICKQIGKSKKTEESHLYTDRFKAILQDDHEHPVMHGNKSDQEHLPSELAVQCSVDVFTSSSTNVEMASENKCVMPVIDANRAAHFSDRVENMNMKTEKQKSEVMSDLTDNLMEDGDNINKQWSKKLKSGFTGNLDIGESLLCLSEMTEKLTKGSDKDKLVKTVLGSRRAEQYNAMKGTAVNVDELDDTDMTDSQLCAADFTMPILPGLHGFSSSISRPAPKMPKIEDGTNIIKGLIKELSFMNKLILKTRREIETARRERQQGTIGLSRSNKSFSNKRIV